MINVTLRQLRYFDALARHGHFGRAAEACAISQPALSMQIKELEDTLGGMLLERSARQVALTRFGEDFARRARDILRSVDELGDFAGASRDRLAGRLRIGMIPTIAPYLLPKVIENLARMHPELDIHVRETLTPKLIKEVVEGRLDTAIVALPVSEPSLTEVVCFSENFLLVRPGEDEGTPVPSHETLREMRLLLLEEGHCFRDQALSFCNMQSPPREILTLSQAIIRPARSDEYDQIARVWMDSWVSTGLEDASASLLTKLRARVLTEVERGWSLYVADDNGVLAAMLALHLPSYL